MILGVGGLDHNGAACLVEDGEIVAMLELERVTRRKNQGIDGPEALAALLGRLGVTVKAVRHVAIADRTWAATAAPWLASYFGEQPRSIYSHHACHLAAAFATSPHSQATVVAVDGKGDGLSASAGRASRARAPTLEVTIPSAHSLGRLWWAASEYAGLPGHHAAGKTMALAATGAPRYRDHLLRHIRIDANGAFAMEPPPGQPPWLFRQVPPLVAWLATLTGEPPAPPRSPGPAHADVAASVQQATELIVERFVQAAVARTGCRELCFAGGVALNGLVNQRLLDHRIVDTLFVPPFTDDRGLAVGAAALAAYEHGTPVRAIPVGISPFLGPPPTPPEPPTPADHTGDDALAACAAELARGGVIGWFEGRDEAGPRALGHRSLLASPVPPTQRDRLNLEIKRREPFRPFGCSILRQHVHAWFECDDDSPYMLRIVRVRPERRAAIPSALHVDGTSRLHTVTPDRLPRLARLLELLVERGHPPLLINTSLNGPGEPIVHTAAHALAAARALGLDALMIEGARYATTPHRGCPVTPAALYAALETTGFALAPRLLEARRLHICNTGLDSIETFDVRGEFRGRAALTPAWFEAARLQGAAVARDALARVLAAGWEAVPRPPLETPAGDYYHRAGAEPFHRSKVRDYAHPNSVVVWGEHLAATLLAGDEVRCVRTHRTLARLPAPPHDGLLVGDELWLTTVDGRVWRVARGGEAAVVLDTAATGHVGWCRGLAVDGETVAVGLTELRDAPRYAWRPEPFARTETAVLWVDRASGRLRARLAYDETARHPKLFALLPARGAWA